MKLKDLLNVTTSAFTLTIEFFECDYERFEVLISQQKKRIIQQYGNAEVKEVCTDERNFPSMEITATIKTEEEE